MWNAAGDGVDFRPEDRGDDVYGLVLSDLAALIDHVQASLILIDSAIDRETSHDQNDAASNVIVLDDVTPCYLKASTALKACNASLGTTLDFLLDSRTSMRTAEEFAGTRPELAVAGG